MPNTSGSEIGFRTGNNFGTRRHFESLCPNKTIAHEVKCYFIGFLVNVQMM